MRYLAWLNAVPDTKKEGERSRRESFESAELPIEFPECQAGYILNYLFELGLTLGDRALSHGEIESWQRNIGIQLHPFEVRFIKRLSETYLSASYEMKAVNAENPWEESPAYMSNKFLNAQRVKASLRKAAGGE